MDLQVITSVLAIIGSIGTIYTFLTNFILNRPHINIELIEYNETKDSLVLYLSIYNFSRLPISITDVTVWNNGIPYSCSHVPQIVCLLTRKNNQNEIYHEAIKSLTLPINLSSLAGTSGYFYFVFPLKNHKIDSKSLTLEVSTNRSRKFQKTLELLPNLRIEDL